MVNDMKSIDKEQVRSAAIHIAACSTVEKNTALMRIAHALTDNKGRIAEANGRDVDKAMRSGLPGPIVKRLRMDEDKVMSVINGIYSLVELPDPSGRQLFATELSEGLTLRKITCPIGVIGIIFESRPDALVQIACLCLKSGNAVILKGGSEAAETNRLLSGIISSATCGEGLPDGWITQLETRAEINEILKMDDCIDLLIPRGSNEFVRYIMENTRIPVIGHSDGICHCYVDAAANVDMAVRVTVDAKTQYAAVCNATETLLVHRDIAGRFLPALWDALNGGSHDEGSDSRQGMSGGTIGGASGGTTADVATGAAGGVSGGAIGGAASSATGGTTAGAATGAAGGAASSATGDTVVGSAGSRKDATFITLRGCDETRQILAGYPVEAATEADWRAEYLDYTLAVKVVGSLNEAIEHINRYGSRHTDAILTDDTEAARLFMQLVDSANVYHNCSTRFSDGFRYGFGAEVGVSTSKIHARGPVGLEGLVTYKYLLSGNGDIVADYEEGRRKFTHLPL